MLGWQNRFPAAGFTILELVVVLLLMGFLSAVAIPRMRNTSVAVVAEADMLRANLRYAQSLAASANAAQWSVQFAVDSYALQRNGVTSLIRFPGQSSSTHMLANGVQVTGGTGTLIFNALGAPATTHVITLSDGTRTESVVVTGFTGLVP